MKYCFDLLLLRISKGHIIESFKIFCLWRHWKTIDGSGRVSLITSEHWKQKRVAHGYTLTISKIATDEKVINEMDRLRQSTLSIQIPVIYKNPPESTTYTFHIVRTIHKHAQDLAFDFNIKASTILCVAETSFKKTTDTKDLDSIFPHTYHNHPDFTNTIPSAKHGVSLYSKHKLTNVKHINTSTLESTSAYDNKTQTYLTCIYRYPNSSIPTFIHDLTTSPSTAKHQKVLIGDFNINIQNKPTSTLEKICKSIGTKQLINNPTTKQNTTRPYSHQPYKRPFNRRHKNVLFRPRPNIPNS